MLEEVSLEVGKSSNRFSSMDALPDLLGDSDLLGDRILKEEIKSRSAETGWSEIGSLDGLI